MNKTHKGTPQYVHLAEVVLLATVVAILYIPIAVGLVVCATIDALTPEKPTYVSGFRVDRFVVPTTERVSLYGTLH